ncbi:hypothetical protein ACFQ5N_06130 [Lutibacter holmesii]|uniref:Uncharacterized protein n=1 Tax=Lutibacter holmesii TaxID=1137985 RepID=A0ABW3WMD4_9FLAO
MEQQRFKKRKLPNKKRLIILLVLLLVITYLWLNSDTIITSLFEVKE